MLTDDQRSMLLRVAREAIRTAVIDNRILELSMVDTALQQPLGAFVTLTKNGHLRGCIGYPEALYPLHEAIIRGAVAAALQDPRFPAVSMRELPDVRIEISVLSSLFPITPTEVEIGVHGLVIEKGRARGLLLPQVPVEWGWNRVEYLAHLSQKAGLHADAWREGAALYGFTAEIFSEQEP